MTNRLTNEQKIEEMKKEGDGNIPLELMDREEFARRIGLSVRECERRSAQGTLLPARRIDGYTFYTMDQVLALKRIGARRKGKFKTDVFYAEDAPDTVYQPSEAAKVFPLLEKGEGLPRIMILTGVHPRAVKAIADDYAKLLDGLYIPKEIKARIDALPLDGTFPLRQPEDLLDVLERCASELCVRCKKRTKTVCRQCTLDLADGNARATRLEMRKSIKKDEQLEEQLRKAGAY